MNAEAFKPPPPVPGFSVPGGGKVVGMVMFKDRIYVATESGVYSKGEGDASFWPVRLEPPRAGFWARVWSRS